MLSQPAPRLLIVGSVSWEGLSRAPYLYSQAGWVVDAFTPPNSFLAQSSFISEIHAAAETPSELVEQLKSFLESHSHEYERILLGDDPLIWQLASRRDEPWARALFPCTPSDEVIDFMIYKTKFVLGCQREDIPLPRSFVCTTEEQITHAVSEVGFPLILKRDQGHSGEGVRIVNSAHELDGMRLPPPVLVQQFIKGQICSAAALYRKGVLLGFYSYFRSRTWGPLGSSTAIKFHVFPGLAEVISRLGRISQFDGLCGIDFMLEESTSRIYILEQNFRPTLTMLLGPKVGVDLVALLRNWNGSSGIPVLQRPVAETDVPLFPADIVRAISHHDLPILLRWLVDPRWIREACWHDRKLLAHNFRFILRTLWNKFGGIFSRLDHARQVARKS
jgi:predicted ATP-grasp superfamily ATP-dependent carboligase